MKIQIIEIVFFFLFSFWSFKFLLEEIYHWKMLTLHHQKSETFPWITKFAKLFRDGYHQINRNIHPWLQVLDSLTFQTNYWKKSSLFFLKRLFYPIKNWSEHPNKSLFYLKQRPRKGWFEWCNCTTRFLRRLKISRF